MGPTKNRRSSAVSTHHSEYWTDVHNVQYMGMWRCQPSCLHYMLKTDADTTHDATLVLFVIIYFCSCFKLIDASSNVHLLGRSKRTQDFWQPLKPVKRKCHCLGFLQYLSDSSLTLKLYVLVGASFARLVSNSEYNTSWKHFMQICFDIKSEHTHTHSILNILHCLCWQQV